MDKRQLIKDIVSFNFSSFITRFYKLQASLKRGIWMAFNSKKTNDQDYPYRIPIIINNFNRLNCLRQLVNFLIQNGYKDIHVLDNHSSYPPLLEYYNKIPARVHYLGHNYGHLALWRSGLHKKLCKGFYVYTDPDILPDPSCPPDFLNYFLKQILKYRYKEKIGFSLCIEDLPDNYDKKKEVIAWEEAFWGKKLNEELYDAPIDTTFALYKPFTNGNLWVQNAIRTGKPYIARHLPWYENSAELGEEEKFYRNTLREGASHWIKKQNDMRDLFSRTE